MLAIWIILLVAALGLGTLAAVVIGIIYGIANKKPGVALASVLLPIAAFISMGLMGLMWLGAPSSGHIGGHGPVQVSWTNEAPAPAAPAAPPMPEMPAMGLEGAFVEGPNPLAIDPDLFIWTGAIFLILCGAAYFFLRLSSDKHDHGQREKHASCTGRLSRAMKVAVLAAIAMAAWATMRPAIHTQQVPATFQLRSLQARVETKQQADAQLQQHPEDARRQIEELQKMADAAAEQAAAAQLEGKNFQEMLEQVTKPRIELGTDGAKLTIDAEPTPTVAAEAGNSKVVVPISSETQESLARTAARLEKMADRVAAMADQLTDTGTLLGKAMVVLNERLDSRPKAEAAPAPQAEMKPAVALDLPVREAPVVTAQPPGAPVKVAAEEISIVDTEPGTIVVKVDRHLLAESGLTFEKLKQELSREGMWHGKVVRFDENKLQITATGKMEDDYLPRLENTLVASKGRFGRGIHLSDLAEVEAFGAAAIAPIKNPARPAWVDEPPKLVGNVRRDVVVTEEYSSRAECERAADVLLLLKTYEHLSQLLGNPRSEEAPPSISLHTETGEIRADGATIYQRQGSYGEWLDYRWKTLADMGIGIDFVRREIVAPQDAEYLETVERSAGPMHKLYTRMEFRPNVDKQLLRRWEELRRGERFAVVGAGAGSVLGLLGLVFGLLKVDTLTKGYYTKRLFLGVPAAIMGSVLALLAWKEVIF